MIIILVGIYGFNFSNYIIIFPIILISSSSSSSLCNKIIFLLNFTEKILNLIFLFDVINKI
jgi:hypothetical protein